MTPEVGTGQFQLCTLSPPPMIISFVLQAVMLPLQQEVYLFVPLLPKVEVSLMIELLMEFIGILAKV